MGPICPNMRCVTRRFASFDYGGSYMSYMSYWSYSLILLPVTRNRVSACRTPKRPRSAQAFACDITQAP